MNLGYPTSDMVFRSKVKVKVTGSQSAKTYRRHCEFAPVACLPSGSSIVFTARLRWSIPAEWRTPTIRLSSFDHHRCQWSLLNRFRTGQGHCNVCHKKCCFTDNELCACGETQTMSHIVNSCSLTKFDCGLLRLHEADETAVDWLTTYGS